MKKKVFFITIIFVLFIASAIIYLNHAILPKKIKSLIVDALKQQTHRNVSLESLKFNIFKGLILRNLNIYEGQKAIISLKEASCTFLVLPIFKKIIVIPSLKLDSAEFLLEKSKEGVLNLWDLMPKQAGQNKKPSFNIVLYQINITNSRIIFQDNAFTQPFKKNLENINLSLHLAFPDSIKFNLKAEIPAQKAMSIETSGVFIIPKQQLKAKIALKDFFLKEFYNYYSGFGINVPEGLINVQGDIEFKDGAVGLDILATGAGITVTKDKISAKLNPKLDANLEYNLDDRKIKFSGRLKLVNSSIEGLEFIEEIKDINADIDFDETYLQAEKLGARILGLPILAEIKLIDFNNPVLNLGISSTLNLNSAQGILKEKLKFSLPGSFSGEGKLSLTMEMKLPVKDEIKVSGNLDFINAALKFEKASYPIENINGKVEFNLNQSKWSDLSFKYLDKLYKTSGVLTNFKAPGVQLGLSSDDLVLQATFAINNKLINLSQCSGRYFHSEFAITGGIDSTDSANPQVDIKGELKIDLQDILEPLKKFQKQLSQIKPEGVINTQFGIKGNLKDIKSSKVKVDISSDFLSLYGLKAKELLLGYNQENGIADIALTHLSCYDGVIEAKANMNLNSASLPYWLAVSMQGLKIEKLKLDTPAQKKDIAGTIQAEVKINGFSDDFAKLSGAGKIIITEGKLWQLNLFQGLGSLLFERDFANIVFSEGSCGFIIQDRCISTNNLSLKSNITDITGDVRIGFDSSINAALNIHVLDEMVPLSGTLKDITTAVIGQAGRFGVIKISGTLKEPKFRFQPAVVDIIKSLKDTIFGR